MEKLFLFLSIGFFTFPYIHAQNFIVFNIKGNPLITENNITSPLLKGESLSNQSLLVLKNDDFLTLITDKGLLFELKENTTITTNEIAQKFEPVSESNFSKQYLDYVWREFNKKKSVRNNNGNVFRESLPTDLIYPNNDIKIYGRNITFEWKKNKDRESTFFFLKNLSNNTIFKMKTNDESITLFTDNIILKNGTDYSWGISKKAYPNYDETTFNFFQMLDKEAYLILKNNTLKQIENIDQLSKKDINDLLCRFYNLCE